MAKTVAQSQQDVNKMSKRDRLWDSLDYSYGQKREDVQKQYDRALSQTDNQFLSRGMQRSSYAGQTMANLRQEGADAVADVYNQQIADYENRLGEIEQQEQAQANWERTFAQNQQQINWNQQYQQGQLDYQQKSADQQYAYNTLLQIAQNGGNATSDLLKRAGISRADFNNMKAKQKKTGGSGRSRNPAGDSTGNPPAPGDTLTDDDVNKNLYFGADTPAVAMLKKTGGAKQTAKTDTYKSTPQPADALKTYYVPQKKYATQLTNRYDLKKNVNKIS